MESNFTKAIGLVLLLAASTLFAAEQKQQTAPVKIEPVSLGQPTRIEIFPPSISLSRARSRQQLVVTGFYTDGRVQDLTRAATWKVSDSNIAELSASVLRPRASGTCDISAEVADLSAKSTVVVGDLSRTAPIEFNSEVLTSFTKQGCNAGACHGSPTGKGGFRLSLQGYDAALDELTLTRESYGRRTDPFHAEESLLLLKPLMKVAHAGGQRLRKVDPAYPLIRDWIAEGCRPDGADVLTLTKLEVYPHDRTLEFPAHTQQLCVLGHFSNGEVRDVTPLAVFKSSDEQVAQVDAAGFVASGRRGETAIIVRYQQQVQVARLVFLRDVPGFAWKNPAPHNYIDEHLQGKQKLLQIEPSELCSDGEFIRRLYLDVLGILPEPIEVQAFLTDQTADKRDRLIETVLARPEYAEYWAMKWGDLLRVKSAKLSESGVFKFHRWLTQAMRENKPYDKIVEELLLAQGSTFTNPAANYFRAAQTVNDCSEATSQLFLGIRIQCAKCHNHPYEVWTQDSYYGIGAFFSRVQRKETTRPDETEVYLAGSGEVSMPFRSYLAKPWLPGVGAVAVDDKEDRREVFVNWLVKPENKWFARVGVNRLWGHIFGRGIVEPVDDFRDSNPPASEELLSALAADFAKSGYDQRHMLQTMLRSRTYQLSSRSTALNADDDKYFSHSGARLLSAEQLLEAISHVTDVPEKFRGLPAGVRATALPSPDVAHDFLKVFGQPARESVCECERADTPKLAQALQLINGPLVAAKLRNRSGRLGRAIDDLTSRVAQAGQPPAEHRALWLRADVGVKQADGNDAGNGSPIGLWKDQSCANRHVEQKLGAKQPLFVTEGIGNLPVVRFDGQDDCLNDEMKDLLPAGSPRTIFVVGQLQAEQQGGSIFTFGRSRDNGSSLFTVQHGMYSGTYYVYSDGLVGSSNSTLPNETLNIIRKPFVTCFVSAGVGAKLAVHLNGTQQPVNQPGAVGVDRGSVGFTVGSREDIVGFAWGGDVSEVLVYDAALSAESLNAVGSYLMTKYGLEASYPEIQQTAESAKKAATSNREIITDFYLAALARLPSEAELAAFEQHIATAPDRRSGLEDVVWTLLNAKEFLFQH